MLNPEKLIKELTLKEKIEILSGYDVWHTHKIERLNIPSLKMSDGPNGRSEEHTSELQSH